MIRLVFLFATLTLMTGCDTGPKEQVVTITTKYGDMVLILYDETPKHKANFLKLAREKYFDGTLFHRVIKGFMIQAGDPDSKSVKPGEHLGNGGPGYSLPPEFNRKFFHEKGALSAARLSDDQNPKKESSGSQFFIVQGTIIPENETDDLKISQGKLGQALPGFVNNPANKKFMERFARYRNANDIDSLQSLIYGAIPEIEKQTGITIHKELSPEQIKAYTTVGGVPYLDGEYTVFGKVIKGLDVIDKIALLPVDEAGRPTEDMSMVMKVEELSRKKIEKLYGYHYPEPQ